MRAHLLGCPFDILTMEETVALAAQSMQRKARLQHVALNVAKFVNMRSNEVLRQDVMNSDIIGIDGMGIVVAARLMGIEVTERVAGVDLFQNLMAVCAAKGFRPYLLGGTPDVVNRAMANISRQLPAIRFAGIRNGYFGEEQEEQIVRDIIDSNADCLFIGMPTPRKERFLAKYRDRLGVSFVMGVGGAFDIVSGEISRAPKLLQSTGCEWLYRLCQEPRKMWRRYLRTNIIFAWILVKAIIRRAFSWPDDIFTHNP